MPSFRLEEKRFDAAHSLRSNDAEAEFFAPETAEEFAQRVIETICRASVTPSVGKRTFERCMRALEFGATVRIGFRHPGKADAIDRIWRDRDRLFGEYSASADKPGFLATLPWIGPVTKHSLARRLGLYAEARQAVA